MEEKYRRIEIIYDRGSSEYSEDGLINNYPFIGVIDGFSPPYSPNQKEKLYNGMSAGEVIRKIIINTFNEAKPEESIEEVTERANVRVGEKQLSEWGISLDHTDLLAGVSFAIAKIEKKRITILQGADCFSLWKRRDNSCWYTKIQNTEYECEMQRIIDELKIKHKGDKEKLWNDFYQPLRESRLKYINKPKPWGYCVLNGQTQFKKWWQKMVLYLETPKWKVNFMLFCTDGFIPFQLFWKPECIIAERIIELYEKKGLEGILEEVRKSELRGERGYTDFCEATGVAIKF